MDAKKANIYSMQRAVVSFNKTAPTAIKDAMYGYNELVAKLETKNAEIGTLNGTQGKSLVGHQLEKTSSKEALVKRAMTIVFLIKAYAIDEENLVLEAEMKAHSFSSLYYFRGSRTADYTEKIFKTATEFQTVLQPFGVTQLVIDNATSLLNEFRAELSKPRNAIVDRKGTTLKIANLFEECNRILYQLDTRVNAIQETQPAFWQDYFSNRIIVDYKGRTLALRGKIVNEAGNPIRNVIVAIPSIGLETKTTEKGNYEFKSLPAGILTLKFNKVNYQETSENVGIVKGERIQLDITLKDTQPKSGVA
jgi:hypothetical protein